MPADEQDRADDRDGVNADGTPDDARLWPLAEQFTALTTSLLDAATVADVLEKIIHATLHVITGADLVSVTLRSPDGRFNTPVRTEPLADDLDQLQYQFGEGPCLDAARQSGPGVAVSPDLANERRWTRFGPAAANLGVGALVSTTLLPNVRPPQLSGALNIYARRPRGLDKADQAAALLLATHASLALAHTQAVTAADLQADQLRRAIDSRDVIGQAKGILMGRRGMSADEAFELLRRTSQALNVKLVRLAEVLATRHHELDLPDEMG